MFVGPKLVLGVSFSYAQLRVLLSIMNGHNTVTKQLHLMARMIISHIGVGRNSSHLSMYFLPVHECDTSATFPVEISSWFRASWTQRVLGKFIEDQSCPLIRLQNLDTAFSREKRRGEGCRGSISVVYMHQDIVCLDFIIYSFHLFF